MEVIESNHAAIFRMFEDLATNEILKPQLRAVLRLAESGLYQIFVYTSIEDVRREKVVDAVEVAKLEKWFGEHQDRATWCGILRHRHGRFIATSFPIGFQA